MSPPGSDPNEKPVDGSDASVVVSVLGPVEVIVGGEFVDIGGPKQRAVVAVLASRAGQAVSTDTLVAAVHGPDAATGSRRSVQTFVSNIRRVVGDAVRRHGDGYMLDMAAASVDIDRFRAMVGAAGLAEPTEALELLVSAEGLWRGDPYQDVDCHTLLEADISRLNEARKLAVEHRLDAQLALGGHEEVIGELETLVERHPFRERLTGQLMIALYRAGRQAEALRSYDRLQAHLVEELGIDPSDDSRDLHRRILNQDSALLASSSETPTSVDRGYELVDRVGEGRFAVVYRARQPNIEREVAVKVIRPEYAHDPGFLRRFESEARVVARLEHPHIVPIHDYWRDPDGAYIAMRLLRGGSLADALAVGAWSADRTSSLITQIAAACASAHRAGVVHHDIKPGNILLDEYGNAYLADFGIASIVGETHTVTDGLGAATPAYCAPEVLRNEAPTAVTDVYALGIVAYEMLTGEHPYPSSSIAAMIAKHLSEPMPAASERRMHLTPEVDAVLLRATAKVPEERFPEIDAFSVALREALGLATSRPVAQSPSLVPDVRPPKVRDFITDETPFGPIAMDEISTPDVYEALYDRDNRTHNEIVRRRPSFIVGRRGSGKTALLRVPLLDPRSLLVEFKSADLFAQVLSTVEAIESRGSRLFVKQIGDIWEGVVWSALCLETLRTSSEADQMSPDGFVLRHFLGSLGDASSMSVDEVGMSYCRMLRREGASIGDLSEAVAEARQSTRRILTNRELAAVVLIDSMEDLHNELDALARPLAGLFGLIGRADRSATTDCDFRFCYPSELWMKLSEFAANPLKDAENHITLHWSAQELIKIAGHRLAMYMKLYHPDVLMRLFGNRGYDPKSIDDAKRVLMDALPTKVTNRLGTEEDPIAYIMRHTQLLPRHLLRILNGVAQRNREMGNDTTAIAQEAVVDGVRRVEELLAAEIFSAYSAVHPHAREACRRAVPELPTAFADGELHRTYNRTGIAKTTALEYFEFKAMLVEIGVLGRVVRRTDWYLEADFDYTLPSPLFAGQEDELCLHPLFSGVFRARAVARDGPTEHLSVYPYGSDPEQGNDW